ncbi:MAG: hypothetical protein AUG89_13335 [Acidobacteria bacterium 13_1_20CM_4_56_7]|nr:MAG: hypothetical protein AUG89_13335 [Acidobacteria bacterium 13_1_20CM_4_56_7]
MTLKLAASSCDVISGAFPALAGFSAMDDCCAAVAGEGVALPFSWLVSLGIALRLATSIAQPSTIPRLRLAGCMVAPQVLPRARILLSKIGLGAYLSTDATAAICGSNQA